MPVTDPQGPDEALARACAGGDRGAFDILVARHQRQVYQLCYRFVGNHEDASELAQDAFVRAYRSIHKFEGSARFTTWLHRISVNVCLNRLSSKRPVHQPLAAIDSVPGRGEAADAAVLRSERAARVRAAIARLPNKQRATLILRAYHELPHEDIGRIVGGSAATAKANFCHALANLKQLLEAADREPK